MTSTASTNEFAPLPHPGFGAAYTPLMVTPVPSHKKPGQFVAFIEKQLCFFENNTIIPPVNVPVEVMITRPLHPLNFDEVPYQDEQGNKRYPINYQRLTALLIQVVDRDKHELIAIDGFETSGSMCRTTANGFRVTDMQHRHYTLQEVMTWRKCDRYTLTPGRSHIREAANVNAGATWKQPYLPKHPTNVWVTRENMERGNPLRVEGLTRIEDAAYAHLVRRNPIEEQPRQPRYGATMVEAFSDLVKNLEARA